MPYNTVLPKDDLIKKLYASKVPVRKICEKLDLGYFIVWGRISRMVRDGEIVRRARLPNRTFGEELQLQRLKAEAVRAKNKSAEFQV